MITIDHELSGDFVIVKKSNQGKRKGLDEEKQWGKRKTAR